MERMEREREKDGGVGVRGGGKELEGGESECPLGKEGGLPSLGNEKRQLSTERNERVGLLFFFFGCQLVRNELSGCIAQHILRPLELSQRRLLAVHEQRWE